MTNKTKIVVWDSNDYDSYEAAVSDKATVECVIPKAQMHNKDNYINAFIKGLVAAGTKVYNDIEAFQYAVVEIEEPKQYSVSADVLEWNRYDFTVTANSPDEALEKIQKGHPTDFPRDDIEWGIMHFDNKDIEDVSNITIHMDK